MSHPERHHAIRRDFLASAEVLRQAVQRIELRDANENDKAYPIQFITFCEQLLAEVIAMDVDAQKVADRASARIKELEAKLAAQQPHVISDAAEASLTSLNAQLDALDASDPITGTPTGGTATTPAPAPVPSTPITPATPAQ